jgi:hypothetical protein
MLLNSRSIKTQNAHLCMYSIVLAVGGDSHCSSSSVPIQCSLLQTQLCSHPIDLEGRCAGYGAHCAKAHGPLGMYTYIHAGTME